MKTATALLWAACAATLAAAFPPGIEQDLECVKDAAGIPFLRWWGVAGRSYFIQYSDPSDPSDPLQTWFYSTHSETGANGPISYQLAGEEILPPPGFFRLRYIDRVPVPGKDLDTDDFDDDGLSNITELESTLTDPLEEDTDKDGIPDGLEDTDNDGMPDGWEIYNELDPNHPADAYGDLDSDGLSNLNEYLQDTDPGDPDTDKDGMPDGWENDNELNPNDPADAQGDPDDDDLTNLQEFQNKTNPGNSDTDGDGLTDGAEVLDHHTSPVEDDTDGDWISDGEEIVTTLTNPLAWDTDGDWMDDYFEWFCFDGDDYPMDPNNPADGLLDTDGDTLPNQLEYVFAAEGFDMFTPDDPLTFPWSGDPDGDGETTVQEWDGAPRTNPKNPDTDGDGIPDDWERAHNLNPNSPKNSPDTTGDPDGDGLTNFDEWLNGTQPRNPDTDGDNRNDGLEVTDGTDPLKVEVLPPPDHNQNLPVPQFENIRFAVGDPSGSESERWKMTVTGLGPDDNRTLSLASPGFGQPATAWFKLRKWNKYQITVEHLATSPKQLRDHGRADYDWRATVDGLPAPGPEENPDLPPDSPPPAGSSYFMVKNHWLVDNGSGLLTDLTHGNETDPTDGISATLVPVDINDNQPASGTDDISCTVQPGTGGRQEEHWIMAPAGPVPEDPSWGNTMLWKTPLPSAPNLALPIPIATPAPDHVLLDTGSPQVIWKGASPTTVDRIPDYRIGPAAEDIALPVKVKNMKKRTVRVVCYKVRKAGVNDGFPTFDDTDCLKDALNRVFGWQVNAWFQVDLRLASYEGDYDLNHDGWLQASNPDGTRSGEAQAVIDAIPNPDAGADIHVYLLDRGLGDDESEPLPPGQISISSIAGCAPRDGGRNHVFISARSTLTTEEDMFGTICHEVGHVFCGPGHPNQDGGPAPLQHTDRTQRLMHSGGGRSGKRLVKAEWDEAEKWLAERDRQKASNP